MSNLQFLQMDVNSMAWWLFLNRQASKSDTMDDFARRTRKPDLLASLSLGVRKEGLDNRGIWITGSFSRADVKQMHELGEAWRDLGLNFLLDTTTDHCVSPLNLRAGMDTSKRFYYGQSSKYGSRAET